MKRVLLVVGLCSLLGCPLQTSSSSTMPSGGGGTSSNSGGGGGSTGNVTVPDVVGKTQSEAEAAVASAGLRGGVRFDQDAGTWDAASKICSQTPGGGQQSASSLFISVRFCHVDKPYESKQPELAGLSVADATKRAQAAGYTGKIEVATQYDYDASCKADTVCRYYPEHWVSGRSLVLYINRKATVVVPDAD